MCVMELRDDAVTGDVAGTVIGIRLTNVSG